MALVLNPVLRVSPPTPVGSLPGRYRVRIWRAAPDVPIGINFGQGATNPVVVLDDVPHLGIRRGDEVLRLNDEFVESLQQCEEQVGNSGCLDFVFYHRECTIIHNQSRSRPLRVGEEPVCCSCSGAWYLRPVCHFSPAQIGKDPADINPYYDGCFYPRISMVAPKSFGMRDMLLANEPTACVETGLFQVVLRRTSLDQSFGVSFGCACTSDVEEASSGCTELVQADVKPLSVFCDESASDFGTLSRESAVGSSGAGFDDAVQPIEVVGCEGFRSRPARSSGQGGQDPNNQSKASECGYGTGTTRASSTASATPAPIIASATCASLGVMQGDRVLRINGKCVDQVNDCDEIIKNSTTLTLDLWRSQIFQDPASTSSVTDRRRFPSFDERNPSRCCEMPPPISWKNNSGHRPIESTGFWGILKSVLPVSIVEFVAAVSSGHCGHVAADIRDHDLLQSI